MGLVYTSSPCWKTTYQIEEYNSSTAVAAAVMITGDCSSVVRAGGKGLSSCSARVLSLHKSHNELA